MSHTQTARTRITPRYKPYALFIEVEQYLRESGLDSKLRHLMKIRASQLNGCAFCLNMHTEEALAEGESLHRVTLVPVWRESQVYTEAERAALELTEAVTLLPQRGVSDEVYERVRKHFSEEQYHDLLAVLAMINAWNRFGVGTSLAPDIKS